MKKLIPLFVLLLAITGCRETHIGHSDTLTEKGIVVGILYTNSFHNSGLNPVIGFDGSFGVAYHETHIPEKYGIVFSCEHGKTFPIMGYGDYYKGLFNKLGSNIGDSVTIIYQEIYESTYEDERLISKILVDYDFLDAELWK